MAAWRQLAAAYSGEVAEQCGGELRGKARGCAAARRTTARRRLGRARRRGGGGGARSGAAAADGSGRHRQDGAVAHVSVQRLSAAVRQLFSVLQETENAAWETGGCRQHQRVAMAPAAACIEKIYCKSQILA